MKNATSATANAAKKSFETVEICERISKSALYILVFLLPIFFLPWTTNVLDFNKQALLIFLVSISLFAWLIKILVSGKIEINLNWINIPVAAFILSLLIATIFSSWRQGSFWGWPLIVSESFVSALFLFLFYVLTVNIFAKKEIFRLIVLMGISVFLVMIFGIFQLFGKFLLPFDFSKAASFSTIGTPNILAIFSAVLLPLFVFLIMAAKRKLKIFFILAALVSAFSLFLVNFSVAWWLVIVGFILVITFGMQKKEIFDSRWLILPMFFLALAVIFNFFKIQIPNLPDRPLEISLPQKTSFDVALKTLKESPIFGSGPASFVFDFSKYKDIKTNQEQFWNLRFENGSSKFINILAGAGILGGLSFLALLAAFIFYGVRSFLPEYEKEKEKEENLPVALKIGCFVGFAVLSVGFFLYPSSLSLDFLFFLFLASLVCVWSPAKKQMLLKPSSPVTLGVTFGFLIIFIVGLGIIILESQRYMAETNYVKGITAWQENSKEKAVIFFEKASKMNQKADFYWRELSQAYLQLSQEYLQDTDGAAKKLNISKDDVNQRIRLLINNAVGAVKLATDVCPKNVANWSVRGFIYQNLTGLVNGAKDWAIKSYEEALALEPVNPYFPTQSGITLLRESIFLTEKEAEQKEKDIAEAKDYFNKAIGLKSDYAQAHFQLAMAFQLEGKQAEAISEVEKAKSIAPFDVGLAFQLGLMYYQSQNYEKAKSELEGAVIMNPNYSNALYFLGLTYDKLGKKEEAVANIGKAADLNPDNAEVKKVLENLKTGKPALEGIIEQVPPTAPVEETPPEIEKK